MTNLRDRALRARAVRDALLALGTTLIAGMAFISLDVVEHGAPLLVRLEAYELDDVLLTLVLAVCAVCWLAWRRFRDARAQLVALDRSEQSRIEHMRRLEELSGELLASEERERQRLAALLHDQVGQTLYAARLKLELYAQGAGPNASPLVEASSLIDEAMLAAKDLTVELSPPILRDLGLREAVRWLLQRLETRYGFAGVLEDDPAWDAVPESLKEAVFASIRELIVNAGKHARASTVRVAASTNADGGMAVTVTDDGCGFDPKRAARTGFGLFSVERRMAWMGGTLKLQSTPEAGTSAVLRLGTDALAS